MNDEPDGVPTAAPPLKSKAKKRTKPKPKAKKRVVGPKKGQFRVVKRAKPKTAVARSERLDMRLTKAEKARVNARAKKSRRTVTSIILEAIEKIR